MDLFRRKSVILLTLSLLLTGLFLVGCGGGGGENTTGESGKPLVRVSLQPLMHGMPTWMAMERGWVDESEIDTELVFFTSGSPQNEALAAGEWDVGCEGTVPALMASIRYDSYIVGISNDESETNDLWVKPDSEILNTKGYNPEYPDIYGTPDDWRGKKILTTTVSTGHYAVDATLKALGLTSSDVEIIQVEQDQAVAAFEANQADIVQFWAPYGYIAESKGWEKVSSGRAAKATIPGAIVVRKEFADQNPELVVEWLDLYMRAVEEMKDNPSESTEWLFQFFNDYAGIPLEKEMVAKEFEQRPVFDVEEQIEMLEDPEKTEKWLADIGAFFIEQGQLTEAEVQKFVDGNYIEPKFMKELEKKRSE